MSQIWVGIDVALRHGSGATKAHLDVAFRPTGAALHLVGKGKAKKLAIVAWMRKLLTILNAMVKHGELWKTAELAEAGI